MGTRALFAYGTLEIPAVMLAVTARSFASEPARLDGFVRFLLRDRAYPGIVETPGATTEGRVYHGVDDASLARLDRFEDDCYERRGVVVRRADGPAAESKRRCRNSNSGKAGCTRELRDGGPRANDTRPLTNAAR